MKQYLQLLTAIKDRGTYKPAARENMPGTQSLFGYQFRHNLADGFPLLTTKKIVFKHVVTELIWFLKGDTNVKFLNDNGFVYWNEDAYNYYQKLCKEQKLQRTLSFDNFIESIQTASSYEQLKEQSIANSKVQCPLTPKDYVIGDCGFQYGKVWRDWQGDLEVLVTEEGKTKSIHYESIDQIRNVIKGLINNPEGRRHIVTAIDPAHDTDLALYWCHSIFQFNCRPLSDHQRYELYKSTRERFEVKRSLGTYIYPTDHVMKDEEDIPDPIGWLLSNEDKEYLDQHNIPKYYLDCQLYQRSADVFLGVPFNIASYALLTLIVAKICNMIPGEYIHAFGDVHIYDNHKDQIELQLTRDLKQLPTVKIRDEGNDWAAIRNVDFDFISMLDHTDFELVDYNPHPAIKGSLSTGLKK